MTPEELPEFDQLLTDAERESLRRTLSDLLARQVPPIQVADAVGLTIEKAKLLLLPKCMSLGKPVQKDLLPALDLSALFAVATLCPAAMIEAGFLPPIDSTEADARECAQRYLAWWRATNETAERGVGTRGRAFEVGSREWRLLREWLEVQQEGGVPARVLTKQLLAAKRKAERGGAHRGATTENASEDAIEVRADFTLLRAAGRARSLLFVDHDGHLGVRVSQMRRAYRQVKNADIFEQTRRKGRAATVLETDAGPNGAATPETAEATTESPADILAAEAVFAVREARLATHAQGTLRGDVVRLVWDRVGTVRDLAELHRVTKHRIESVVAEEQELLRNELRRVAGE